MSNRKLPLPQSHYIMPQYYFGVKRFQKLLAIFTIFSCKYIFFRKKNQSKQNSAEGQKGGETSLPFLLPCRYFPVRQTRMFSIETA